MTHPSQLLRLRTALKAFVALACLGVLAMWLYFFFWAPRTGLYQLDSASWRAQARVVCTAAKHERLALTDTSGGYIANPTTQQMAQRADIVDKATDIVEKMLDDIMAIPVTTERDHELLATFDKYYRMLIADRRRYTASLRQGKLVSYTETVVAGGPVSNVLVDFTIDERGNNLPDCTPPNELGGDKAP